MSTSTLRRARASNSKTCRCPFSTSLTTMKSGRSSEAPSRKKTSMTWDKTYSIICKP